MRNEALKLHKKLLGKIEVNNKIDVKDKRDLSLVYSPGVAEPCREIFKNKETVYEYTSKGNTVAIVTDGSAVLGLGNIGPEAALPVMEGKSVLLKKFAGVNTVPICLSTQESDEIVNIIKNISATYGAILLEDIAAPRCIEIEERLKEELDIPVFHDDQHGTAIVTMAGLINAAKLVNKDLKEIKVVVNGIGAAGSSITKLLLEAGIKEVILCDKEGILNPGTQDLTDKQIELAEQTNPNGEEGGLDVAIKDADVFIGVSVGNILTKDMLESMGDDSIIFAMANPDPEVKPDLAKEAGSRIVGTGRSDYPNQVNNLLAFPGVFKGLLSARATDITDDMKLKVAYAIAKIAEDNGLNDDYIIPDPFDKEVVNRVANTISKLAREKGLIR
ncbi:NAD(P)-dependent malic enzyme [Selenihalanaerobacter shriftii]|uniref:Malate dehydrogenase (Oxaloacetate-decarboxylating) n=1 Tax=Selenihalanaerobacter shriftii TaxID=142842 RepID=A0A1T4MNM6_9FIRM|nr:NADP-dependent malic enzyme [Selenihalanaerobacter shriftii]SJZ68612.1 malate dehydrogenase (oxaloacetate-decarboxylating) [Selenihalanaerobacter shriftii]